MPPWFLTPQSEQIQFSTAPVDLFSPSRLFSLSDSTIVARLQQSVGAATQTARFKARRQAKRPRLWPALPASLLCSLTEHRQDPTAVSRQPGSNTQRQSSYTTAPGGRASGEEATASQQQLRQRLSIRIRIRIIIGSSIIRTSAAATRTA